MAIHADYPGLTVEIYVDGKPLEEHEQEEEEDAPKTTTRYVECRSGAEFAIHTNFKAPFAPMDMDVRVYLDGTSMHRRMVHRREMFAEPYIQFRTKWRNGEKWHASKFLFSDLDVGMKSSGHTFINRCSWYANVSQSGAQQRANISGRSKNP